VSDHPSVETSPSRPSAPRAASSTTEKASQAANDATSKAKSTAANLQSKASEGLSRVQSAAGPALKGAGSALSKATGRIGGRTGRLINRIEAAIPPTIYYSKVGLELSKLVFQGQKMSPPSLQTFQTYFNPILNAAKNPQQIIRSTSQQAGNVTPNEAVSQVRNVSRAQLITGAIVFAEILGFFTVGEMIGRMKIVGYRGEVHHEH